MSAQLKFATLTRKQLSKMADGLAVALAVSLPWSTSATSILAVLWLLALIPTIDIPALKKVVLTPAGGAPLIFVALGAAGMFWAGIAVGRPLNGISSFLKLLFVPLLLFQFSRSERASEVLIGFLVSCGLAAYLFVDVVGMAGDAVARVREARLAFRSKTTFRKARCSRSAYL